MLLTLGYESNKPAKREKNVETYVVTERPRIREVIKSNFEWNTTILLTFFESSQTVARQLPEEQLKLDATASFHILFNSLLHHHSTPCVILF
jgi:hypothetical protein